MFDEKVNVSELVRQGWNQAKPEKIPDATFWPVALVFGLTLSFWGMVTSFVVTLIGLVVFVFAIAGWIGDLRHE